MEWLFHKSSLILDHFKEMLRTFRNRLWKSSLRYSSGKFSNLPKDLEPEDTVDFDLTVEYPGDFEIALDKIREETSGMDGQFDR